MVTESGTRRMLVRGRGGVILVACALVGSWLIAVAPGAATAETSPGLRREAVRVPVSLTPGGPEDQLIWGQLCSRGAPRGRPVQLLVHGFTLTHAYWDFPCCDRRYSYVESATERGYTTRAVDRIGVENSSTPPAPSVTQDSHVDTLHQVIQALRGGSVTGAPVPDVILVGHSFGSVIGVTEVGRYHDADRVIATGFLHTPDVGAAELFPAMHPVQLDPTFATAGLPLGDVTTRPGTRTQFYEPANADPTVIATDEQRKGTGMVGEVGTFAPYVLPLSAARYVDVPVLLAVGERDRHFCSTPFPCCDAATVVARELPYFGPRAELTGFVLPNAGHNMALHLNSAQATDAMVSWTADVLST